MATLQDAIEAIQTHALALSGMKEAPSYAPEKLSDFPFAVSFPGRGSWGRVTDRKKGLHTIITEIHVARKDMARDLKLVMPYSELFPNAVLGDPTLGGDVDTVIEMRYTFSALNWDEETQTVGWRFETDVKQQSALT